jgi:hypothetical protein
MGSEYRKEAGLEPRTFQAVEISVNAELRLPAPRVWLCASELFGGSNHRFRKLALLPLLLFIFDRRKVDARSLESLPSA